MAKDDTNGTLPAAAKPAPTLIKFCSAMPTLKNRSGNSCLNTSVLVDLDKSASKTIILVFSLPIFANACPYASRVAFPIILPPKFLSQILQPVLHLVLYHANQLDLPSQKRLYLLQCA